MLLMFMLSDLISLCLLHGHEDVLQPLNFSTSPFTMKSAIALEWGFLQGMGRDSDSCVSVYGYLISLKPFIKETALANCTAASPLSTHWAPCMY